MYECDKNQMFYYNVNLFKKSIFWEFWAIDRTRPTFDKFYYYHFHKWKKIDTLEAYINLDKIISFDMKKKDKM